MDAKIKEAIEKARKSGSSHVSIEGVWYSTAKEENPFDKLAETESVKAVEAVDKRTETENKYKKEFDQIDFALEAVMADTSLKPAAKNKQIQELLAKKFSIKAEFKANIAETKSE